MKISGLFVFLLIPFLLPAQTVIKGKVSDGKIGLPGANVFIKDSYDGITSDPDGNFEFESLEEGKKVLVASFVGYETSEDTIILNGETITINPSLKEEFNELRAVVISAGAFEASDEGKAVVFSSLDIVTTAGSDGDIYGALQTLPGAQTFGNEDGLFVRGGQNYETKTVIDGMTVQNPYSSNVPDVPSRGRFTPFLFKGTVFSTGGYSAEYGQALSSAVILNSTDFSDQTASGLSLSPIFVGGFHNQSWEKTSVGIGLNYVNVYLYDLLVPQAIEFEKPFQSFDGSFFGRQKTSQTGLLKFYSTYSQSNVEVYYEDIENPTAPNQLFKLTNQNTYVNASWKEILGQNWTINIGSSYSNDNNERSIDTNDISGGDQLSQVRLKLTNQLTEKVKLKFGAEYNNLDIESRFNEFVATSKENYGAAFLESDFYLSNKLAGRIGVRSEYSQILGEYNIAPRASLAYSTGDNGQVSLAYGHFYQTPQSQYLNFGEDLTFERADHYIANWQIMTDDRTFRIEGYYKTYKDLVLDESEENDFLYKSGGTGYARGIEFFYRDQDLIKYGDWWVSYSYLDTKRKFLDYPEEVQPEFAADHSLSVVAKYYIAKIQTQIGATYAFNSGRPYFNPNSSDFLSDEVRAYHNFSMNVSYLTSIKGNFTVIFASVGNIFGIDHLYGYRYNMDGTYRQPITDPSKRTYFLGMFISFVQQ